MAKKVRKPRSQSPRTFAQSGKQPAPAPAPAAAPQPAVKSAPAPAKPAPARQTKDAVDLAAEYKYVIRDLRRTLIVATGMLALLVVLNFIVQ